MMRMKLVGLTLYCRSNVVTVDFSSHISFFYGPTSAGKSSIARLIDFCFGGNYVKTQALKQELVTVTLAAQLNGCDVLLEREAERSGQVQVTWQNLDGTVASVLAPFDAGQSPILGESVYNLSDLIFHLCGITPIKVRKSKFDEESSLARLSFRDFLWYCYLDQVELDSSFFALEHPFKKLKSRDVMRFVVGLYSERLNELEIQLEEVRKQRIGKVEAVKQLREFLRGFGYASENQISDEIERYKLQLNEARSEQTAFRQGYMSDTHFADELRSRLNEFRRMIGNEEQVLNDLSAKIDEQEELKAELLSTKFKLLRVEAASSVLSKVSFELCPCCGTRTDNPSYLQEDRCSLCGRVPTSSQVNSPNEMREQVRNNLTLSDINSRIKELGTSIEKHKQALDTQKAVVEQLRDEKILMDRRLTEELAQYDSAYLSRGREIERQIGTLEEKIRNLEEVAKLPEAVDALQKQASALLSREEQIESQIQSEKSSLIGADRHITAIENSFLEALLAIGLPDVHENDEVKIDRNSWVASILHNGDREKVSNFYTVSAGIRPLLNVCYALAVHQVAAEYNLPLPTFLIIDSPIKNIGNRVDSSLITNFYKYLYQIAVGSLADTQMIIIDQEYIEPDNHDLDVLERLMTRDDPDHPPLIPTYRES